MKRVSFLLLIIVLALGACTMRSTMNSLELGMTKRSVVAELGQPRTKTVAPYGESWGYNTHGMGGPVSYLLVFGSDGTLIGFGPDDQRQLQAEQDRDAFIATILLAPHRP